MNDLLQSRHCAKMLHALAAADRLRIICFLRDGERNVTEISESLGTTVANVSHHISVLRHAGIVRGHKCGRFVYYSLPPGLLQHDDVRKAVEYFDLGCCRLEVPRPEDSATT